MNDSDYVLKNPPALTENEVLMYGRFAELLHAEDRDAYYRQLSEARVRAEDNSHTSFAEIEDAPKIDIDYFNTYLEAFYDDRDGATISMLLHFVYPGYINWIERFRYDDNVVTKSIPDAEEIRFAPPEHIKVVPT